VGPTQAVMASRDVAKWRTSPDYSGVTPISRKLIQDWADPHGEYRVLFRQREVAETAIFLTKVEASVHRCLGG
jgi:type III restriction enzyme